MDEIIQHIRAVVHEFPGDWKAEGVGNALYLPQGVLRVGPQGVSLRRVYLSLDVYIVSSGEIVFHRSLDRDGNATHSRLSRDPGLTGEEWLRQSIREALDFLNSGPTPKPLPSNPTVHDILFGD